MSEDEKSVELYDVKVTSMAFKDLNLVKSKDRRHSFDI